MKVSNFKLAIGIPLNFPWVPASFFYSFIQLDRPDFIFLHAEYGSIDAMRNDLVMKAMEANASHLIMMDTDQIYHPNTITRLLSHRLPAVGAMVHRRYPPFDNLMLKVVEIDERTNSYVPIYDYEPGSLVEVDATGGGCLMFDMEVFYNMPKPWFRMILQPDGSTTGEDIAFCQALKAAGYKIFVDTSVPAGHLTTMIVNEATSRLYRAKKQEQKEALSKALMGDKAT